MPVRERVLGLLAAALLWPQAAQADAVAALREFVRDARSGRAEFTQTVTSPDGAKKRTSSGSFEFARPNRFRFAYLKPYEQLIVADGKKVWLHDADLNQVSIRPFDQALGATPAALLSGTNLERDFELQSLPTRDGLDWVQATPRSTQGNITAFTVGFKGRELAVLEITDSFGQRSRLQFNGLVVNPQPPLLEARFRFSPPPGADVVESQ